MYLEVFADNPFATNCWLMARDDRDDAVVVDPGFWPERVHALLNRAGRRPAAVLAAVSPRRSFRRRSSYRR